MKIMKKDKTFIKHNIELIGMYGAIIGFISYGIMLGILLSFLL